MGKINLLQIQNGQEIQDKIDAFDEVYDNMYKQVVDNFTPTAGQTVFTLSKIPNNQEIFVNINGLDYYENADFTVSRSTKTVTWTNAYTLEADDKVKIQYYVQSRTLNGFGIDMSVSYDSDTSVVNLTIDGTTYHLQSASAPTSA